MFEGKTKKKERLRKWMDWWLESINVQIKREGELRVEVKNQV